MEKIIALLLISILCLCFALIPEFAMFLTYKLINPEDVLSKILIFGFFWFAGAGFCFIFGWLGFIFWVALLGEVA